MIALITGGASGIGRALATRLAARGDTVVIADLRGAAAAAKELGLADGVELDVRDAAMVEAVYRSVHATHGRLDLVFNNAGIAVGGAVDELTLDHWNQAIDVNLRGVVHGVHAAYPIMLAQGSGHIVNTASLAGLVPAPLLAPYTATKFAVVGLSLALRTEAAGRGVRVSAVCPGFVDTPLLDNANPDLPSTRASRESRARIRKIQPRLYSADKLAGDVLRGIARNKGLIVAPASARFAWRGMRMSPGLVGRIARIGVRGYTGSE